MLATSTGGRGKSSLPRMVCKTRACRREMEGGPRTGLGVGGQRWRLP